MRQQHAMIGLMVLLSLSLGRAGQVPGSAAALDIPVSSKDRVYLSDQTSNSVSVVDPSTNKLLGIIQLGGKLPETLSAVYRGQSLVHGMGFSPDHKTLAIVCVGSNALVFVDTNTNKVKHITYVGRAPHEAMWTPNGNEVWVTVRGEDYIQVLDGKTYKPTRRITVPSGPGMTIFSPNGKYAYICSSFTPETVVIDTKTYSTVGRIAQDSVFCPNIAATPDGKQVWFTLKDTGRVQVIDAQPPFKTLAVLETGAITNHVNFAVVKSKGQFAYVTIGALREVKVFTTADKPQLVATIPMPGDNPHGLWPSGDGSRMYVGLQLGNAVVAIDTASNRVAANIDVGGQAPMAMMYVPNAVQSGSNPTANLVSVDAALTAAKALHLELIDVGSKQVRSSVAVNNQGLVDSLEAAISGLQPGKKYVLALATNMDGSGDIEPVASFMGGKDGAASSATIGPFRDMIMGARISSAAAFGKYVKQSRFLVVAPVVGDNDQVGAAVQVQQQAL